MLIKAMVSPDTMVIHTLPLELECVDACTLHLLSRIILQHSHNHVSAHCGLPFANKEIKAQEIKVLNEVHLAGKPGFKPISLDLKVMVLRRGAICPPPPPLPGDIWQYLETFLETLYHC